MKHASKIDVPVLITFFCRPDTLQKVFDSVREARPSTLLLWQDGPRANRADDMKNVQRCRDIVENIDWECKVYKNYHDVNMGCDPSTYLAQKWAFEIVDKCIIMEDDRVPVPSFYKYCKELLDKYENDERISHICGTNLLDNYEDCPYDYFFSPSGSTTWASWRRVAKDWDETYSFLHDEYSLACLKKIIGKDLFEVLIANAKRHSATGFQWWESILGMSAMLHNRIVIIPKRNMVVDLGLTDDSTHATSKHYLLPKIQRDMFYMKAYEVGFPLNHPKHVLPDYNYLERIKRIWYVGHPFLKYYGKFEFMLRCAIYGEWEELKKRIIR
ncbi:MAG: hemolysin activation protein [Bacteroidaceae bacterium]|nr:hemolysin activation protein [Bacteroidaceae bacterium]